MTKRSLRNVKRQLRAGALRLVLNATLWCCRLEDGWRVSEVAPQRRILIIVFGGLGDCLLFDPLFRRIKEQWNGVCLDVITGSFEQMWQGLGSVDELMYYGRNTFKSPWAYFKLFRQIYRRRYDIAVEGIAMMPKRGAWSIVTSLLLEASNAPIRIGRRSTGRLVDLKNKEFGFLGSADRGGDATALQAPHASVTRVIEPPLPQERGHHEAYYVAQALGVDFYRHPDEPRLFPDAAALSWADTQLESIMRTGKIVVGVVLETTYGLKRWPPEKFREVVRRGVADGLAFVLIGHDPALLDGEWPRHDLLDLSGRTNLAQMIAVTSRCNAFLAADTGPAHVAQACGVPTVVLFGPSNEREFGPVDRETHTVVAPTQPLPCRPCVLGPCVLGHTCMNFISVDHVYDALTAACAHAPRLATAPTPISSRARPRVVLAI